MVWQTSFAVLRAIVVPHNLDGYARSPTELLTTTSFSASQNVDLIQLNRDISNTFFLIGYL